MPSKYRDCSLNRDVFDQKLENSLGSYVYLLVDPNCNKPFYIGKAGGSGQGNDRLLGHFDEARKQDPSGQTNEKIKKIHEIWDRGEEVDWFVIQCEKVNDAGDVALQVEAALIQFYDTFSAGELTNKQKKFQEGRKLLSKLEVFALGAEELKPEKVSEEFLNIPIMLFNISKGYEERGSYEEALVRAWKIGDKYRRLEGAIAVGLVDGISRIALRIKQWMLCEAKTLKHRYEIIPDHTSQNSLKPLETLNFRSVITLQPSVSGFWQNGAAGGPIIFKINDDRKIKFLRGLGEKTEAESHSGTME